MAILTEEIINPQALSSTERERLADELYTAHQRIFEGVEREPFVAYVIDTPAVRTRIQVFRTGGLVVGYAAFHAFERSVGGRRALVLRAEVGLLPTYRRRTRDQRQLLLPARRQLVLPDGSIRSGDNYFC
ncbi:MAG: hypothetical protein AAGF11_41320 [Myxococcota bacterium]